ncbi:MAG: L-threonylcarbamoyladenylate synthase [Bacilli bacterium]
MEKKKFSIQIQEASFSLLHHGVVAFPTETVMGLGVVYDDKEAYDRLNIIKHRPEDRPYTMMLAYPYQIEEYAIVSLMAQKIIKAFIPGSITLLLPAKDNLPLWVTHGSGVIGVRVPTNVEALLLLKSVGVPLLVPSANRSGEKPAYTSEEVKTIFGDELDYIVSGKAISEMPSTIVDLTSSTIKIVRQGPITIEQIVESIK